VCRRAGGVVYRRLGRLRCLALETLQLGTPGSVPQSSSDELLRRFCMDQHIASIDLLVDDAFGPAQSNLCRRRSKRRSATRRLAESHVRQVGAGGDAQLGEDLAEVIVDRARAEDELCRDLAVGHAVCDETGDLELLRRQLP